MTIGMPDRKQINWRRIARWALIPPAIALALFLALYGYIVIDQFRGDARRRAALLAAFTKSFNSEMVELVGVPTIRRVREDFEFSEKLEIAADQVLRVFVPSRRAFASLYHPFEYRIDAVVKDSAGQRNGAWKYWSQPDSGPVLEQQLIGFYYAESPIGASDTGAINTAGKTQWHPPSQQLVDGIPVSAGAEAKVVRLSPPQSPDDPWRAIVRVPTGTTASISFLPAASVPESPSQASPDGDGEIEWTWQTDPQWAGKRIQLRIDCSEPRGNRTLVRPTWQIVDIPHAPSATISAPPP